MLAAFLKAIGFIIPLMDAMYANYYTREVMVILVREFQTPDEEMKKIVLKVRDHVHLWECIAPGRSACVCWLALGIPTPLLTRHRLEVPCHMHPAGLSVSGSACTTQARLPLLLLQQGQARLHCAGLPLVHGALAACISASCSFRGTILLHRGIATEAACVSDAGLALGSCTSMACSCLPASCLACQHHWG